VSEGGSVRRVSSKSTALDESKRGRRYSEMIDYLESFSAAFFMIPRRCAESRSDMIKIVNNELPRDVRNRIQIADPKADNRVYIIELLGAACATA
jgi:hypothetical protein